MKYCFCIGRFVSNIEKLRVQRNLFLIKYRYSAKIAKDQVWGRSVYITNRTPQIKVINNIWRSESFAYDQAPGISVPDKIQYILKMQNMHVTMWRITCHSVTHYQQQQPFPLSKAPCDIQHELTKQSAMAFLCAYQMS